MSVPNQLDHINKSRRSALFEGALSNGQQSEGVVLDVSRGGAGIQCSRLFENDQFVQLQIQGREPMAGRIIRKFDKGIAIEFGEETRIDEKALEELEKFRQVRGGTIG